MECGSANFKPRQQMIVSGKLYSQAIFGPQKTASAIIRTVVWVGPKSYLDAWKRKILLSLSRIEPHSLGHLARKPVTTGLCYHSSVKKLCTPMNDFSEI